MIPGHEISGVVETIGSGVDQIAVGDRVALCPIVACGRCTFCLTGRRHRCPQRLTLGYDEHGGLAEWMLVPASLISLGHVLPVPADVPLQRACLTEPAACVLNSLETCGLAAGGSLAIVGAGPMGLLHLLLARRLGVTLTIVSEPDEERAAVARRFGATLVIDPRREQLSTVVLEATAGQGADAVVVSAGLPEVLKESLAATRRQGVLSLFAGFPPETSVPFDPNAVHYSEVRLTGSQNASPEQYRRMLQLLATMPEIDEVTSHRVPLADATEAYEVRLRGEGLKSMVVVNEELA